MQECSIEQEYAFNKVEYCMREKIVAVLDRMRTLHLKFHVSSSPFFSIPEIV